MSDSPRLVEMVVGDEPATWAAAGFAVDDDGSTRVGGVRIWLVGPETGRGVRMWSLTGVEDGAIDGLPTATATAPLTGSTVEHANTAVEIDHVVVTSPDVARTIGALAHVGLEPRRSRDIGPSERPMRQVFFRLGDPAPILELVGPREPAGDGPAEIWGLTVTVADLDLAADRLGDHLKAPKPAVQPGRRIATVRHAPLGASLAIALMTPHVR